ncbi:Glyco-hydro-cc domain-containing protein [Mycena kentingensis (nom. inval.)]|nr:Glyco-hydro-cc domain-containing protein [Mycena kentingensis (nom. inval.)]
MKFFAALTLLAIASTSAASPIANTTVAVKRSGPGKRGLAWPWYNTPLNPGKFHDGSGSVTRIYDWETYAPPSSNGKGGLNFIGMQRCMDCDSSPIGQLAARQKQVGFATVFTLNEPDINGITPAAAAEWYIQHINPLSIKKAIPAVTSSTAAGQGLDWAVKFRDACAGRCFFDYVNIHWYGETLAQFKAHVTKTHNTFPGKKIVISEFALRKPGSQAAQVKFFKAAFKFLDAHDYVAMYFPFVATSPKLLSANDPAGAAFVGTGSTLFDNDGTLSPVGKLMLA